MGHHFLRNSCSSNSNPANSNRLPPAPPSISSSGFGGSRLSLTFFPYSSKQQLILYHPSLTPLCHPFTETHRYFSRCFLLHLLSSICRVCVKFSRPLSSLCVPEMCHFNCKYQFPCCCDYL